MTTPAPDLDLFVSHASADDAVVSQIDAALNAAGITTWVDHEHGITYGERWMDAIHEATLRCTAALYVLTPESARSQWCLRELMRIQEQLKRTVYVALLKRLEAWQIPMIVNDVQYADLTNARLDDVDDPTLRGLADAIQGKPRWERTLVSEARTQRVTGAYPFGDLQYTLYGRDDDLREVTAWLSARGREAPMAMVLGIGGVGKTRLAVEIVNTLERLRDLASFRQPLERNGEFARPRRRTDPRSSAAAEHHA